MDRNDVERWVDGYERAWRAPGTDLLAELFAPEATYLPSPWAEPVTGLEEISRFWEDEREGPDEPFELSSEVVVVDGDVAVVRTAVEYLEDGRWRNLWVVRFDAAGRCLAFEEWTDHRNPSFAPGQPDGHDA